MVKRGNKTRLALYFILIALLMLFLFLHAFYVFPVKTDTFTKFLISLLVVVLLVPVIPKVKIFDIIDVRRDSRFLSKQKRKQK